MAASDNVVRGGLTRKHVDLDELLRLVRFSSVTPQPLRALRQPSGERVYPTGAAEFRLGRVDLARGERFGPGRVAGADVLLVLDGEVRVDAAGESLRLARGAAVLATHGLDYDVDALRPAAFVRASIP